MNETKNFTWLPFFNAMLKKICSEYDKKTLWEVFKKVYADKFNEQHPILTENPGEIDPFTFIAMLNANDSIESRQELCNIVKKELKLSEPSPLDFNGITFFNPIQRFFYNLNDYISDTMDSLWELASYVANNTEIISDEIGENIDIAIQNVDYPKLLSWGKICKILFVCFPDKYFPADTKICAYSGIKSRLDNFEDFKKYQQALKDKFNEPPYIVSYKAINGNSSEAKMETENKEDTPTPQYWLRSSNPKKYDLHGRFQKYDYVLWPQININFNVNDIVFFYSSANDRRIRFKTIVKEINVPPEEHSIDTEFWKIEASRTNDKYMCLRLLKEVDDDSLSYENLIKLGYIKKAPQGGLKITNQDFIDFLNSHFEGKTSMKPETKQNNPNIPLNQILYGPPGTGKTYNTVIKAMEIINPGLIVQYKAEAITYDDVKKAFDEAKKNGQIEFVTFHQSYAYEEFVEGIKPDLDSEDLDRAELKYVLKDGIFKEICKRAENPTIENQVETGIRENPNIWKVSLKGSGENPVRTDCMDNNRIRIGWDEYGETIDEETDFKYGGKDVLSAFMDKMQIGDIVLSCYSAETIDAIGVITSEYAWDSSLEPKYKRYRKVKWLVKGLKYNILKLNNDKIFAPATVYQLNNISLRDILDIVKSNGQTINYKTDKPYVLIIDEINRGNISKIFGELITLIEPDKRQGATHEIKAKLPYSQSSFAVPQNLYIIGTMNTSDRSIAAVDIALRRRFKFIEMMPDSNLVANFGIGFQGIFEKLNKKIKLLLDRDHQIGHSYFINTKYKNADAVTLKEIWFSEIIPLLNEYFYCDWEKLKLVVPGFITKVDNIPAELKDECEDSAYEFKTEDDFKDIEDFTNALKQDKFEKES